MNSKTGIPTMYDGYRFRSRLEARWAAFFDLAGWEWKYEPIDLDGWIPDFWVAFTCSHSECSFMGNDIPDCCDPRCFCRQDAAQRSIEAAYDANRNPFTKYDDQAQLEHRDGLAHREFNRYGDSHYSRHFKHELLVEVKPWFSIEAFDGHPVMELPAYDVPSPAAFGVDPGVTYWEMAHGAGGGTYDVPSWVMDWKELWAQAANRTQWNPR